MVEGDLMAARVEAVLAVIGAAAATAAAAMEEKGIGGGLLGRPVAVVVVILLAPCGGTCAVACKKAGLFGCCLKMGS